MGCLSTTECTYLPTSSVLNSGHPPLLYRWEGQLNRCSCSSLRRLFQFFAQAKTGAGHKIQPGVARAVRPLLYPRCAGNLSTPSLQALSGKRILASLLGHSRLVALCSLVPFTGRPLGPLT